MAAAWCDHNVGGQRAAIASGNATDSSAVRAARPCERSMWITRPSSTSSARSASSDAPGPDAMGAPSIETVSNETVAATTEAYGVGPMEVRRHRGWTVVEVTGDLEMASAPALRQLVVQLLSAGARHIAVDLTAVDFLDS